MASIGHFLVGAMIGRAYQTRQSRGRILSCIGLGFLALLPDCDVINLALGAPDRGLIGHRGLSHAWLFALLIAALAWVRAKRGNLPALATSLLAFATVGSHGILDAFTEDSRGIFLFWPFSSERIAFPWRPIPNPPTGLAFLSYEGFVSGALEALCFAPMIAALILWPNRTAMPAFDENHARRATMAVVATTVLLALCMVFAVGLRWAIG